MVLVSADYKGKPYHIDDNLHKNLVVACDLLRKNWDMVFAIDGYEGSGKSVLALQIAKMVDPTFNISRVVFKAQEFTNAIAKAEKYQAIVFDEAFQGLSSRESMRTANIGIVKLLAEIRQKNLFVLMVCPSFMDLDGYVAKWRTRCLIHVYTDKHHTRGQFCMFDKKRKLQLYIKGKKEYNYRAVKANFIGRFPNAYTIDPVAYEKKKLINLGPGASIEEDLKKSTREFMEYVFVHRIESSSFAKALTLEQKGWLANVHPKSYNVHRRKYQEWVDKVGKEKLGELHLIKNESPRLIIGGIKNGQQLKVLRSAGDVFTPLMEV